MVDILLAEQNKADLRNTMDLFSEDIIVSEEKRALTEGIPIKYLNEFEGHTFVIREDEDMKKLRDGIKTAGKIIKPLFVRKVGPKNYEIISGHRRTHVAKELGFESVPCVVLDIDHDEAVSLMVSENLDTRECVLPSEKAFSYKLQIEALKRQGKRIDLTSSQLGTKFRADEKLAQEVNESRMQIQRYIRLTFLTDDLLKLVDEGKIKLNPAVEISYLDANNQDELVRVINETGKYPKQTDAAAMRQLAMSGLLNESRIRDLMLGTASEKRMTADLSVFREYIPAEITDVSGIKSYIKTALEFYKKNK